VGWCLGTMTLNQVLEDLVALALEEARGANCKVIVSYTEPLQPTNLLNFVAHQADDYRFFWQRRERQWGGGGRIWVSSSGAKAWGDEIGALRWHGLVVPYFFGGLPFDSKGKSCLWLPQWLVGEGRLVVWDWVLPDMEAEESLERIEGLLQRLREDRGGGVSLGGGHNRSVIDLSPTWRQAVGLALKAIGEGTLEKVVLSRALEVIGEGDFSAFGLLNKLREGREDTILFLMELGGGKTFVGATPEMLLEFRWGGDRLYLKSDALAGSSGLGGLLLSSEKDLAEHQIVIDSIREAYGQVGAEVGTIPPTQLLRLQDIQHLYTPIPGEWSTGKWQDVFQLLVALHPTAAVGGKPRAEALAFIQQFETWDREGYAAPIGWFNGAGVGEFAVAIRSGYVEGNRVRMFAGAGIVRDSQIDREWAETSLKLKRMLRALGLGD